MGQHQHVLFFLAIYSVLYLQPVSRVPTQHILLEAQSFVAFRFSLDYFQDPFLGFPGGLYPILCFGSHSVIRLGFVMIMYPQIPKVTGQRECFICSPRIKCDADNWRGVSKMGLHGLFSVPLKPCFPSGAVFL